MVSIFHGVAHTDHGDPDMPRHATTGLCNKGCATNTAVTVDGALTLTKDNTFVKLLWNTAMDPLDANQAINPTIQFIAREYRPWAVQQRDKYITPEAIKLIRGICAELAPNLPTEAEIEAAVERWQVNMMAMARAQAQAEAEAGADGKGVASLLPRIGFGLRGVTRLW